MKKIIIICLMLIGTAQAQITLWSDVRTTFDFDGNEKEYANIDILVSHKGKITHQTIEHIYMGKLKITISENYKRTADLQFKGELSPVYRHSFIDDSGDMGNAYINPSKLGITFALVYDNGLQVVFTLTKDFTSTNINFD